MVRLRLIVLAAGAAVLLGLPIAAQAQSAAVEIRDNSFAPATVTVTAGTTVTWTQTGSNPHTVTADDGSFDASTGKGSTFEHTFDAAGTYAYYCRIHGASGGVGMAGTVVVTAAASPSPTPEATPTATATPTPTATPDTAAELPRTGPDLRWVALAALLTVGGALLVSRRGSEAPAPRSHRRPRS